MALGVPRTRKWHTSMHTWAPRHVWRAPRGHNSTGPSAAYLLLALARECLKTCAVSPLEQPWAQCHGSML